MTDIYIAKLSPCDEELYESAYALLPPVQRQKTESLKSEEARSRSLGAWLLLIRALEEKGIRPHELALCYNAHGKPYLADRPDIFFNLSHSDGTVMCAVSQNEVGCDTERIRGISDRLAERFFHPDEVKMLNSLSDTVQKERMFFRLWTLKESFMKATGQGFSLPMRNFCIDIGNGDALLKEPPPQFSNNIFFKEYFLDDGCCYACCAAQPDFSAPKTVILK